MQSLTPQTGLVYRTRLLTQQSAERFASCLRANSAFTGVEVVKSDRAKGEKSHFVAYVPQNTERRAEMKAREQAAREDRAATEAFTFALDKDAGRSFVYCLSHKSGEVYEVTGHSCSCPDWQFRCRAHGLHCKHQLALIAAVDNGEVGSF